MKPPCPTREQANASAARSGGGSVAGTGTFRYAGISAFAATQIIRAPLKIVSAVFDAAGLWD
jgi:hypothetical protein